VAKALGDIGASRLNAASLAGPLSQTAPSAGLSSERRGRIERALAALEQYLDEHDRLPEVVFLHPPELPLPLALADERAVPTVEQRVHPDPLAAAVGYFDGTAGRMAELFRAVRVAELEVNERYDAAHHDEVFAGLDWEAFTSEELSLLPRVAVVTTGRRLRRRGQGALSELLRSSRPVHVIVHDDVGARDEAQDLSAFHVDLGYLVMAHREVFAVSSTLARPDRLTEGLTRLVRAPRPGVALVHLPAQELAPLRPLLAEAALRGWADRFDVEGNPQPECAWPVTPIAYLEDGEERSLELEFTFADAVALEPAYRNHLRVIPRCAWDDEDQLPLAEFLEVFDPETHPRAIPYIWVTGADATLERAILTRELALACRDRLRGWRVLQELAGYDNAYAERAADAARERVLAEATREREALEQRHAQGLAEARGEGARESMERLAAALTSPDGITAAVGTLRQPTAAAVAPPATRELDSVTQGSEATPSPAVEAEPEEDDEPLSFDEPYIDAVLCTTCNECTNMDSRLFQYNADKQAFIADPSAGSFAVLVKAAEKCPADCIHPGKPRSGDATATPELIERAAKYN
jgi:ferredoxin